VRYLLVALIFAVPAYLAYRNVTRRDRALENVPAGAIRDDTPFIVQARENWQLAGRAVHSLERIVNDDDIWPLIREEHLSKARRVISDYYRMEEA
jgi:hypothetical protein